MADTSIDLNKSFARTNYNPYPVGGGPCESRMATEAVAGAVSLCCAVSLCWVLCPWRTKARGGLRAGVPRTPRGQDPPQATAATGQEALRGDRRARARGLELWNGPQDPDELRAL